ncbi:hypothetical protein I3843_07G027700 [Carya illinoinensis]|nr:hypothetical protein I3843_07G027700 [Carya illinoinensis]
MVARWSQGWLHCLLIYVAFIHMSSSSSSSSMTSSSLRLKKFCFCKIEATLRYSNATRKQMRSRRERWYYPIEMMRF